MRSKLLTKLSLILTLALAGCATSGRHAELPPQPSPPACHLPPVDSSLMATPDYVKMISDVFFLPSGNAKPSVIPSNTP